jgi:hypothetical protein
MPSTQSRRGVLATGAAALAALAGCSVPGEQEVRESVERYDVGDATDLVVTGTNGDVSVSAGSGEQVVVDVTERTRFGTEHFADVSLAARRDGETLRLDVEYADGLDTGRVAVDLDVAVPDGLALRRAATTNGDAAAEDVAGDARLETVNGDASATDVSGFVTVVSENGDVDAAGVDGLDGARTTNGAVTAEVPALRGDATARSVNGDVALELGAVDATLDARTDNGEVTVTGLSMQDTTTSADRVRGTLGDGTHALTARTTNGDVTVRSL